MLRQLTRVKRLKPMSLTAQSSPSISTSSTSEEQTIVFCSLSYCRGNLPSLPPAKEVAGMYCSGMSVCSQRRGRCDHCEPVQTCSLRTLPPAQSALLPSSALQYVALAPGHVQTCSLCTPYQTCIYLFIGNMGGWSSNERHSCPSFQRSKYPSGTKINEKRTTHRQWPDP